jgi:glycosyltransferase involved in cell wall biosynthesis
VRRINGWRRRLVVARLRRAAAAARAVICTSQAELDELARLGVERTRLVLVPNGIDLPAERVPKAREEARAALGISEGEVVALYLGQLEERKDPLTAVRAVEAAGDPRLRLLVAGDGPLLAEVLAAAGPATSVLGFRDDPDRLLLASDLFVMPSLREGASFAVLEAMGMGLPMVMSDGAGNPELVGDAGIVFPTGDVGALADAFRNLAADADARRRAGEAARARVAERFTRTGMRDAIQQVYVRALAPSRR